MDDFKENNGIQPVDEPDNTTDSPENTNPPEDIQANKDQGITITEPDTAEADCEPQEEMCILCGEKPVDKSRSQSSDLCSDCRETFIKTPLRFKGFIAVITLFVLSVAGLIMLYPHLGTITTVADFYMDIEQGNHAEALSKVSQSDVTAFGWKTAGMIAEFCYDIDLPDDLAYLTEQFFYDNSTAEDPLTWSDKVGKSNLNAPWNKELKEKYNYVIELDKVADEQSEIFAEYYNKLYYGEITEKDIPYDELIKKYEDKLASAKTNEEKGLINYYMLALSSICSKDIDTQLKYCEQIVEFIPNCRWIYLDNIVTLSIQAGKHDQAKEYIDVLSKSNPDNANYAKRYNAMLLRYEGKYDEAMEVLDSIIADIANNGIYEAYYDALICQLLAGDYEAAYGYAKDCFEQEAYLTVESINLYAILSKKLDEKGYDDAVEFLKQYDMKISPTAEKCINGEITIEQLFKNGEVVFE